MQCASVWVILLVHSGQKGIFNEVGIPKECVEDFWEYEKIAVHGDEH